MTTLEGQFRAMRDIAIVIPNWNGATFLPDCLDSCLAQTYPCDVIVVDNGSIDSSVELVSTRFPSVRVLTLPENLGFAGGVNVGLRYVIDHDYRYVALLNNDARLTREWVATLVRRHEQRVGIVTGLLLDTDGSHIDSSGDMFSSWGIPFARDRGKPSDVACRRQSSDVFAASGGASLLSVDMLRDVGLFDEKFFAYYEDVDLSFRAGLRGWRVVYEPAAVAFHQIAGTSSRIVGFAVTQTLQNLPLLFVRNVPTKWGVGPWVRFAIAYAYIYLAYVVSGQAKAATTGTWRFLKSMPHALRSRRAIQRSARGHSNALRHLVSEGFPEYLRPLTLIRARRR